MTYSHTGRIGDYAQISSLNLHRVLECRIHLPRGAGNYPRPSGWGAFLPLSARCCHPVQRPSRADGGCYPEGCRCDSIAPSAVLHINRGSAQAGRRFWFALPNAPHSRAALDLSPRLPATAVGAFPISGLHVACRQSCRGAWRKTTGAVHYRPGSPGQTQGAA